MFYISAGFENPGTAGTQQGRIPAGMELYVHKNVNSIFEVYKSQGNKNPGTTGTWQGCFPAGIELYVYTECGGSVVGIGVVHNLYLIGISPGN